MSSTLTETTWRNSQIIGPYDAKEIQRLKEDDSASGLYVSGSATLVRALLADGLVDELHLFVYPVTRAAGPRLFGDEVPPGQLEPGRRRAVRQRRDLPEAHPCVVTLPRRRVAAPGDGREPGAVGGRPRARRGTLER